MKITRNDLKIKNQGEYRYYRTVINGVHYLINANSTESVVNDYIDSLNEAYEKADKQYKGARIPCRKYFTSPVVYRYAMGAWSSINQRTVNGLYSGNLSVTTNPQQSSYLKNGVRLEITQDKFYRFIESNSDLIVSIYNSGDKPSVDRVDNDKDYTLDNIRVVALSENIAKRNKTGEFTNFHASKLKAKVYNRKQYIKNQKTTNCERLAIDKYFDESSLKDIISAIETGIIQNAFQPEDGSSIVSLPKIPRGRPITKKRNQAIEQARKEGK